MKDKLIIALIAIGIAAAGWTSWKLVVGSRVEVSPSPAPVSVPQTATTSEMMQLLNSTVDDGGASEMQQLEQEAAGF